MSTTPNALAVLEDIMNNARAIANDAYNGGAGEILTDTAPFTIQYINSSLQELQDRLENNAAVTLTVDNFIITGLEAVAGTDPSLQTFIDYSGYYSLNSSGVPILIDATKQLPDDLMVPQKLWERQTGSNLPFVPMTQPMEGLISMSQTPSFAQWELRESPNPGQGQAIWFRGATVNRDIRIRYQKREANVAAGSNFTNILIDLPGASNALAYLIAFRYVMSRNPDTAPIVRSQADYYIREIIKRVVRQKQGVQYQRQAYGGTPRKGYTNRIM